MELVNTLDAIDLGDVFEETASPPGELPDLISLRATPEGD